MATIIKILNVLHIINLVAFVLGLIYIKPLIDSFGGLSGRHFEESAPPGMKWVPKNPIMSTSAAARQDLWFAVFFIIV